MELTAAGAADDILGTISDLVLLIDPQGTTLLANRAAENLLGVPATELVGRPWRSRV